MRPIKLETLAVVILTMLGHTSACKASDVKYDVVGQVRVDLRGLDLQDPADARRLLERLNVAAYHACGDNPKFHESYKTRPQRTLEVFEDCRTAAVERAVNQISSATLTQAYADSQCEDAPLTAARAER